MQLLPRVLQRSGERLIGSVPQRWQKPVRAVLIVLAAAFVAFEISRFWLAAEYLSPLWAEGGRLVSSIAHFSPLAMAVAFAVSLVAFVLPMAGIIWLGRLVLKRSS